MKTIEGNIILIKEKTIRPGRIIIENTKIKDIIFDDTISSSQYILPGLIDSHVHIESSMMTPQHFSNAIVPHGTIAVVTDPHEISNVLGVEGFQFMLDDAKKGKIKTFFGVPSCVPATPFETSGAVFDSTIIADLLKNPQVVVLSEMMNFPGVIYKDDEVLKKIEAAKTLSLPIDGHAPGLQGKDLDTYIAAGISTDHEASTFEEGEEKIKKGMKILIREGSAARNFEALYPLIEKYPDKVMLCTDDSHPDEIQERGHIDKIIRLGIQKNIDIYKLLQAACLNPVEHYRLPVGTLNKGDFADFIVVDNLTDFTVLETYINGEPTIGKEIIQDTDRMPNVFNRQTIQLNDIELTTANPTEKINVIQCFDGELLTKKTEYTLSANNGKLEADMTNDILKLVVINRYDHSAPPAVAFIKGFELKDGALASTVAHDSHNIIAVGTSDELIVKAVNLIIAEKGGIAVVTKNEKEWLPLPIAGLMSNKSVNEMATQYKNINTFAHRLGIKMKAPFMTLSFMALPVIPEIKLSDKGLFDAVLFKFMDLIN